MIKHVWECFYFSEVLVGGGGGGEGGGSGRRKFCFFFAIPTALQRLSESTFQSSVLLRFGRCPSFARLSFWSDQHEAEVYGALMSGEKPAPAPRWPPQISHGLA